MGEKKRKCKDCKHLGEVKSWTENDWCMLLGGRVPHGYLACEKFSDKDK